MIVTAPRRAWTTTPAAPDLSDSGSFTLEGTCDSLVDFTAEVQSRQRHALYRNLQEIREAFPRVDIAARIRPAPGERVCGDGAFCFVLDDQKFCAILYDVNGKGLTAARVANSLYSYLRSRSFLDRWRNNEIGSPRAIIESLEQESALFETDSRTGVGIGVVFCCPEHQYIEYASNGMPELLIIRRGNVGVMRDNPIFIRIGCHDDRFSAPRSCITSRPTEGMRVILHSDGVEVPESLRSLRATRYSSERVLGDAFKHSADANIEPDDASAVVITM